MRRVAQKVRDVGPSDLSLESSAAAHKLIGELTRLYGRVSECLDNPGRRDDLIEQIHAKQDAIQILVPSFARPA